MKLCNDCTLPKTCEINNVCDFEKEQKRKNEVFLKNFEQKIYSTAYEKSNVKLQIYEYQNKVYFNCKGNKFELANLLFEILISEPNNDFLQIYNQYIRAKLNYLQKIKK